MAAKRSQSAAMAGILLALLTSVTLIAGCVAVPPTLPTSEPTAAPTSTPVPAPAETPVPLSPDVRPTPNPAPLPTHEQDCLKQGGTWGPQGISAEDVCDLPTTDAGQPCTDSSQCEGLCFANAAGTSGTCSPRRLNFSCYTIMKDGAPIGLCVN